MIARDTGFPRADAEADFLRARRQQVLAAVGAVIRGDEAESTQALSFGDVVDALGFVGEQGEGVQIVPIDGIVGSVDKVREFDPKFRPRTGRSRRRWERLAEAARRGEPFPPIDVYRIGRMYFVRDGHHRVSVYRSLKIPTIEADVTRVFTLISPDGISQPGDLARKQLRRVMIERMPLDKGRRVQVKVTDPYDYPVMAERFEAWAARTAFHDGVALDKKTAAVRWFDQEYLPAVELIDKGGLRRPDETRGDAYLRVSGERYYLLLQHIWDEDVIDEVRRARGRADKMKAEVPDVLRLGKRRRKN